MYNPGGIASLVYNWVYTRVIASLGYTSLLGSSLVYRRGLGKRGKTVVNIGRKEHKTVVNVRVNVSNVSLRRPWVGG